MRIAITGGAGFIGSNIADAYVAAGHQVLVLDDLSSGQRAQVPAGAELSVAEIRSSEAARALRSFGPEVLNHHAGQIDVRRSVAEPRFDLDVNVGGLLNLLEAARPTLRRVVYAASGGSMYGETPPMPTPETAPCRAVSPYGISKHAAELYLSMWHALYGLHYVALRYSNVYGPRQNAHGEAGVVAIFCERLMAQKPCTIYGDGLQTRDFVHVRDVVAANVLALTTSFCGGVNIATGVETDVNTVYARLAEAAQVSAPPLLQPARAGEVQRSVLDPTKAKAVLGWSPTLDIAAGLRQTWDWFRARS